MPAEPRSLALVAEPRPFDPAAMLAVLEAQRVDYVLIGGLAAALHGSPHVTTDVDITPSAERDNLMRLSVALEVLDARIRVEGEPEGIPFDRSPETLARTSILNLTTRYGDLDITREPSGTRGYDDLRRHALEITVHDTRVVVAALADIVRSKEAANREKDRLTLPALRRLLDRLRSEG